MNNWKITDRSLTKRAGMGLIHSTKTFKDCYGKQYRQADNGAVIRITAKPYSSKADRRHQIKARRFAKEQCQ